MIIMDSLEQQVKAELVKIDVRRQDALFKEPKYQQMLEDKIRSRVKSLLEGNKFITNYDEYYDVCKNIFYSIRNITDEFRMQAESRYWSIDEITQRVGIMMSTEFDIPVDEWVASLAEFENDNKRLLIGLWRRSKVVGLLAETAKEKGLENAISKGSRYDIIRQIFPSDQDYITNRTINLPLSNALLLEYKKIGHMFKRKELGFESVSSSFWTLLTSLYPFEEKIAQSLEKDLAEREATEIYGAK